MKISIAHYHRIVLQYYEDCTVVYLCLRDFVLLLEAGISILSTDGIFAEEDATVDVQWSEKKK